ncbi:MAG: hypothetical protein EB824_06865 [Thaumarchaeota archaeon S15]|nr:MAG: hypothetical protein EB824_06865 [Thaumarchaeota archaeon S15]
MGNNRNSGDTPALMLLAVLLAAALPWAFAQSQDDGEVERLADELRQLRGEMRESNRVGWALFVVSLAAGTGIAALAIWGTLRNTRQLERHVKLLETDMTTRLRPLLRWTSDRDKRGITVNVPDGRVISIRIVNAGQVAAVGIVCDVKYGMASDFEAGKAGCRKDQYGSLAPNRSMDVNVWVSGEQVRMVREEKKKFRMEIHAEYRGPDGREYAYSMSGDYDGWQALLHD